MSIQLQPTKLASQPVYGTTIAGLFQPHYLDTTLP